MRSDASLAPTKDTKILDLGSETGSNISAVLDGTSVKPENIYIADIDYSVLEKGRQEYGYIPVLLNESEKLPFADGFFDIVYCSSVIEHVTVSKNKIWTLYSGGKFSKESKISQKSFTQEIKRIGKQYFVRISRHIHQVSPLGFKESLYLWKDAMGVFTDSGGLQEQTTGLGIPCFTLRENTERPVTIDEGTNTLVGSKKDNILKAYRHLKSGNVNKAGKILELWDGKAA